MTEMRMVVFRGREFFAAARANSWQPHSREKCESVIMYAQVNR